MMKRCKIIIPSVLGMVLLIGFSSCEKLDYGTRIANFADVFFIDKTQNVNLDVKYEGHPIKWDKGAGKIRTLEGEGNFEFYDKITGKVLANRKVNVKAGSPESYLVFQPTESEPISFLDPNGQAAVSTPEPGFMKIKVANFAPNLLPFSKIDLIVYGFVGRSYVKVGTIENVGQSLDNEEYHLVSKGDVLPSRPNYQFSFVDHVTKQEIKNSGGTNFTSPVFSDRAKKGIYTLYLLPQETFENPFYIKYGDNYYGLTVNVLFAD